MSRVAIPRLTRTSLLLALATLVAVLGVAAPSAARPARPARSPDVVGQWEAPFDLGVVSVHAILMPNGKVLLFSEPDDHIGSEVHVWDPSDDSNLDVSLNAARNIFCAGHLVLPDGRVLIAGGTRYGTTHTGTRLTSFFDPATNLWSTGPLMTRSRWYPTPVQLPGGRVLLFAGQANKEIHRRAVDGADPGLTSFKMLPDRADRLLGNYPSLHLLPNGTIFSSVAQEGGIPQHPAVFRPKRNTWSPIDELDSGARFESTSVLLPGLHEVMVIGGTLDNRSKIGEAIASTEIFDVTDPMMDMWMPAAPMAFPRRDLNAVLLADGSVLAVGGGGSGFAEEPVLEAERYDPETDTWTTMAAQQESRMHHSVATLLPDGRVLSTGQTAGTTGNLGEVYSPPYLFQGPRPTISDAPETIGFDQPMAIQSPDAGQVDRVALIRPGSVTHGVDFTQRYVDLSFTDAAGVVNAISPADGRVAPPGWYMLVIVDNAGVPSVADWVKVG